MYFMLTGLIMTILYVIIVSKAPIGLRRNRLFRLFGLTGMGVLVVGLLALYIGGVVAVILRVILIGAILFGIYQLFIAPTMNRPVSPPDINQENEKDDFIDYDELLDRDLATEVTDFSNVRGYDEED